MNIIDLFKKQFLPDGQKIARSLQDHNPPPDWIFRGFRDENDQEIYLADHPDDKPFWSDFSAVGYVSAANNQLKIDGMNINLHFVLSEKPSKNRRTDFNYTKQGGLQARGYFCGYFKQFHVENCHDEIKKMIFAAYQSQAKIKISGTVNWTTFIQPELQKDCEFLRFDRKKCCPCIILQNVDYVSQSFENNLEIRRMAARPVFL